MTTAPLVLLDLDGTLTDSAPIIRALARETFVALGLPDPGGAALSGFVGPGLRTGFTQAGLPADRLAEAITVYRARYVAEGIDATRAFAGIAGQLAQLRAAGTCLIVATSKPEPLAVRVIEHTGLTPLVDAVFGAPGDDVPSTKADVIARALGHVGGLGRGPQDVVMVGDREHDVLGARAHAIACLGVEWGAAAPGELAAAGAVAIVPTVPELAGYVLAQLATQAG